MTRNTMRISVLLVAAAVAASAAGAPPPSARKPQPYRLPGVERMGQIMWGSECEAGESLGLRFGGEDQKSDDGAAHTEIRINGRWTPIVGQLRSANPLARTRDDVLALRGRVKDATAAARYAFFEGKTTEGDARPTADAFASIAKDVQALAGKMGPTLYGQTTAYVAEQCKLARATVERACKDIDAACAGLAAGLSADALSTLWSAQVALEQAAELLDCEPAPRALSPIVYDAKSKLFVIFGGDHLDYLTNDTWVFDPAGKRWEQRHPKAAPPPRADHRLAAAGDGKVKLAGGYTYSNNPDYCGGQYIDLADGDWTYDVAADVWTGEDGREGVGGDQRVYRAGPFHPDFFMKGDRPDAAAFAAKLKELPVNTWVATRPPQTLRMNRDWGTAVIDPDRDVMLRWSGGHSAHGGSDVPMFHFATNRWELPFPIEFPLGQTYSNTSYPGGFNFNRRPWVTGHTYKGYDYDPASKQMVFVGHNEEFFIFDPAVGDWVAKLPKPKGMIYGGCFYDLLCRRTSDAVVCWTKNGQLFRYDGKLRQWNELKVAGENLPGSSVDAAGIDYDGKRDRILLFPARYGDKAGYNGQVVSIDLKERKAERLTPAGAERMAGKLHFMRETCYDAANDVVLCGSNIAEPDGSFQTALFDCAANAWRLVALAGPNPAGKTGRDVSMGLVYDARRKLAWSTDTYGNMYVLRLDLKAWK